MKVKKENLSKRLNTLHFPNLSASNFVGMNQIHSDMIHFVDSPISGEVISETDGLLTSQKGLFLGVNTADCVPIFFYDPQIKIIGVVHAGWKGTLKNISGKMVNEFFKRGACASNVLVAVGPHIGGCCYDVSEERAQAFQKVFNDTGVVIWSEKKSFVDLGQANILHLLDAGILRAHIDAPITCTSCQNEIYFSYRKDSRETFGEMLGVIGIKN